MPTVARNVYGTEKTVSIATLGSIATPWDAQEKVEASTALLKIRFGMWYNLGTEEFPM